MNMARRTKAELLVEIDRVARCYGDMIDCLNAHAGDGWDYHDKGLTVPVESYLAEIDAGQMTASQALSAWREALNELALAVSELLKDGAGSAPSALMAYRAKTGRTFWEDAGRPKKLIAALLDRGKIDDEADYYSLKEAINDVSGGLIKASQRAKAEALLIAFEETAAPDAVP